MVFMVKKIYFLLLVVLLSSCTTIQPTQRLAVATVTVQSLATVVPSPIASTPVASTTLVPKHHDLIFVEFFAVT